MRIDVGEMIRAEKGGRWQLLYSPARGVMAGLPDEELCRDRLTIQGTRQQCPLPRWGEHPVCWLHGQLKLALAREREQ